MKDSAETDQKEEAVAMEDWRKKNETRGLRWSGGEIGFLSVTIFKFSSTNSI